MNTKLEEVVLTESERQFLKYSREWKLKLEFGNEIQRQEIRRIDAKLDVNKKQLEDEIERIEEQIRELEYEKRHNQDILDCL